MPYIQTALGNLDLLEGTATIVTIIAVWFISKPKYIGQQLMLIAQLLWFGHSINKASLGLAIQSTVLLLFSVMALIHWRKKGIV